MATFSPGRKTILVVEDQQEVRGIMARVLIARGYSVIEAFDGQQALEVLMAGQRVDLLIVDIVMPGLNGLELAKRLSTRTEARPTPLFVSGFDQDPAKVPAPLLKKPFSPEELIAEVERLIH